MARSRLYQSRCLQVNTHFAAFFEIYKIHTPLHRSKLKILSKFVKDVAVCFRKFQKRFDEFDVSGALLKISQN